MPPNDKNNAKRDIHLALFWHIPLFQLELPQLLLQLLRDFAQLSGQFSYLLNTAELLLCIGTDLFSGGRILLSRRRDDLDCLQNLILMLVDNRSVIADLQHPDLQLLQVTVQAEEELLRILYGFGVLFCNRKVQRSVFYG